MGVSMSLSITGNKGFHIRFENGITISIQFGAANYCEHYNGDIGSEIKKTKWESIDAEVGVWDENKKWYDFKNNSFGDSTHVVGYKSADEIADLITKFKNWKNHDPT